MSIFSAPHLFDSHRWRSQRVGLLGGSFNPPHEGHLHISHAALHGLKLDAIWWLLTPQNPLKSLKPLSLKKREALCHKLVNHPKILISTLEENLGTTVTYESIKKIKHHFPTTDFVWISGMDNAQTLHTWNNWKELLSEICMLHLSRPPAGNLVQNMPLRQLNGQKHVFLNKGGRLPLTPKTSYWMVQKKMVDLSSTDLRLRAQ